MAGPITPLGGPQLSQGLPRTRPAGKFVTSNPPTPNISRAFARSEGGAGLTAPPAPAAFGTQGNPVGVTGGADIGPVDQLSAIQDTPGRGLSSRFQGPPGALPGIAGPAGGSPSGLEGTDPLDELLRSLLG